MLKFNIHYTWFKDDVFQIAIAGDSTYIPIEEGWYRCEVTSDSVTVPESYGRNIILNSQSIYFKPPPTCRERDSLVLLDLHASTNGGAWVNTWDLSQPIDTWHGVTLNAEGCVDVLDLFANNLVGNIPESIGEMLALSELDLAFNNLSDTLPTSIGNLENLVDLYLYRNNLTGNIPESIGQLSNLSWFIIYSNNLTGNLPESIGQLQNLVFLNVAQNELTGSLPESIGQLSNILTLNLGYNNLSGNLPATIGQLASLQNLNLSNNNFSGTVPQSISQLNSLFDLKLDNNNFTFAGMETVATMPIFNGLSYAPQDTIPVFSTGDSLYVEVGGVISNNHYTWYRDGISQDTIVGDSTYALGEPGWYHCEVRNDIVTNPAISGQNLVLTSPPLYYDIQSVWPGDFNNDGIVDNLDVLYWGLAEGFTGPTRPNATTDWVAQGCPEWADTIQGVNAKHQDADGNGIVDEDDLAVVLENYGKTRSATLARAPDDDTYFWMEPAGYNAVDGTRSFNLYMQQPDGPIAVV